MNTQVSTSITTFVNILHFFSCQCSNHSKLGTMLVIKLLTAVMDHGIDWRSVFTPKRPSSCVIAQFLYNIDGLSVGECIDMSCMYYLSCRTCSSIRHRLHHYRPIMRNMNWMTTYDIINNSSTHPHPHLIT